jgi:hypothetical protein
MEKKKGIFTKMVGAFVEITPDQTTETTKDTPTPATVTTNSQPIVMSVGNQPTSSSTTGGIYDPKIAEKIKKAMETANLPGMDYFEFANILQTFEGESMSEAKKYELAFKTLKSTQVDTSKVLIITTADHYLEVLDKEEEEFKAYLASETAAKVSGNLEKIKNINDQMKKKQEDILRLQNEIKTAQEEAGVLQAEVQNQQIKLETTGKNYTVTLNDFRNRIKTDKINLDKYIQ